MTLNDAMNLKIKLNIGMLRRLLGLLLAGCALASRAVAQSSEPNQVGQAILPVFAPPDLATSESTEVGASTSCTLGVFTPPVTG